MFDNGHRQPRSFAQNLQVVVNYLKQQGAAQVVCDYSGSGDSGDVADIAFFKEDKFNPSDDASNIINISQTFSIPSDDGASGVERFDIEDFMWDAIDHYGHGGFWNNEGGRGDLTIHADGRIELNHQDYVVETVHDCHEDSLEALLSKGEPTISHARIVGMPRPLPEGGFGDAMPQIMVRLDRGTEGCLFSFYPDEISFDPCELVGLTLEEARALKRQKDKAYLQAPEVLRDGDGARATA